MTNELFCEDGLRLLTGAAFTFVLGNELRRAMRSQNFITLIVLSASSEREGRQVAADEQAVRQVAQLISREVRDTDLLGYTTQGKLSLALLDADFEHSRRVVDRLTDRFENYDFPTTIRISVGAACYPTHAVLVDALHEAVESHQLAVWRYEAPPRKHPSDRNSS